MCYYNFYQKFYCVRRYFHNMKIIIAGIGPGNPELISLSALNAAKSSDLILVPRSHDGKPGVAEKVISRYITGKKIINIIFPMIRDEKRRDKIIFEQLKNLSKEIQYAEKIFFPVIGDPTLYSTGAYLLEEARKIFGEIEFEFIPGISAHSLAAACAKKFMAMSDEIFTIIPGTTQAEKILNGLKNSDAVAIYKPVAIKNKNLFSFIKDNFKKIIRVDFAGIPEKEKIFEGYDALKNIDEYLSIILLWKDF